MQATVQKWGNSLGIRIPKSFAKDAKIEEGTEVDLSLEKGFIQMKPKKDFNLKELLKKISKDNIHEETNTGNAVGGEVW